MNPAVLVGLGGIVGALTRHAVGQWIEREGGDTFAVNVLGSFLLGAIVAAPVGEPAALALGTGFCGAFTTFSTFAFETVRLYEDGRRRRAIATAAGHLGGALIAVGVGTLAVSVLVG
ncbi:CrcB family protein [Halorhabdus sp. CUG00001]|uniref:fluoride efflux transporter FluC n=1 Tax=Halorhabdus sp. CUG00001 TaxID=2600297 RepID=UPI00131E18E1|nr:CrcB family protein [Halorhabdus sp. CUG00001]